MHAGICRVAGDLVLRLGGWQRRAGRPGDRVCLARGVFPMQPGSVVWGSGEKRAEQGGGGAGVSQRGADGAT